MKPIKLKFVLVCCIFCACIMILDGCKKSTLSPARNIIGTWKSLVPVTVYYLTNYNSDPVYSYKTFQCKFTFVITSIDDNNVMVNIYGDVYDVTTDDYGESPPIAGGYPISFDGLVSSSSLTLNDYIYAMNQTGAIAFGKYDVGDFTFTTHLLTGNINWVQYYSSLNAIGWKTDQISLTKQ